MTHVFYQLDQLSIIMLQQPANLSLGVSRTCSLSECWCVTPGCAVGVSTTTITIICFFFKSTNSIFNSSKYQSLSTGHGNTISKPEGTSAVAMDSTNRQMASFCRTRNRIESEKATLKKVPSFWTIAFFKVSQSGGVAVKFSSWHSSILCLYFYTPMLPLHLSLQSNANQTYFGRT